MIGRLIIGGLMIGGGCKIGGLGKGIMGNVGEFLVEGLLIWEEVDWWILEWIWEWLCGEVEDIVGIGVDWNVCKWLLLVCIGSIGDC